jgi:expansin (peptidoglycan-binding protein)
MAVGHHRRRRSAFSGRRFLLGLGITGAGLAAIVVAIVVGVGQVGAGQACTTKNRTSSALSLAALSVPAALSGPAALSRTVSGIATHYVLTGLPNCSYPSPPSDQLFVALSPAEYNAAGGCGGYLQVNGPDGSVRVEVIDQCPECATGHLDLSEPAFAKLSPLGAGLINVSYTYLTDPALPGPISMEVKSGSSRYWLALLADNTGNPLASVQVQNSSGSWIGMARADYNYWIAPGGAGSGPFTVRLTDTAGNQTTVSGITLSAGTVQTTRTYMYGAGSAPAPVPTTPPVVASTSGSPSAPTTAAMTTPPATRTRSASASARKNAKKHPSTAPVTSAKAAGVPTTGQPTTPTPASSC